MARAVPWLVPGVVVGSVLPALGLAWQAWSGSLGADPVAISLNRLGLLALVLLVAALACTPVKALTGWVWPIRVRRALGLLGFAYATLHFLVYVVVDQGLDVRGLVADVVKRPFITVGVVALALLAPLAWTSTDAAVRQLGFARWKRLHRLAYPATVLAGLHFLLRVKKDVSEPVTYLVLMLGLLAMRVVASRRETA